MKVMSKTQKMCFKIAKKLNFELEHSTTLNIYIDRISIPRNTTISQPSNSKVTLKFRLCVFTVSAAALIAEILMTQTKVD